MDFKKWLLEEMPLSNYKTKFVREPYENQDFYFNKVKNKKDKSQQVSVKKPGDQKFIEDQFSKKDRLVITHPKTLKILENKLSNSKYNFNILLVESLKKINEEEYVSYIEKFMNENNIKKQNHITFAKNGTSGHILTPWMILHTLGHAVTQNTDNLEIESRILNLLKELPIKKNTINPHGHKSNLDHILAFKSIQNSKEENDASYGPELVHELIVEYLWNGGEIRIKKPYDNNATVVNIIMEIEDIIDNLLDNCVGRIITDFETGI